MKTILQKAAIAMGITALAACSQMGWNKEGSQGGSTHTMTGGAEATTTDKATPQPAGPKGSSQGGTQGESQGTSQGSTQGTSQGTSQGMPPGDASTGGAEGAQTPQATPGAGGGAMPQE